MQKGFISSEAQRIETVAATLWPKTPLSKLVHWSEMTLPARVKKLDLKIQEMYARFYRQLSWNVQAGVQGVIALKPETFAHMCGMSYNPARMVYEMLITDVIRIFRLSIHDPSIDDKMTFARYVPLTTSPQEELKLRKDLNL